MDWPLGILAENAFRRQARTRWWEAAIAVVHLIVLSLNLDFFFFFFFFFSYCVLFVMCCTDLWASSSEPGSGRFHRESLRFRRERGCVCERERESESLDPPRALISTRSLGKESRLQAHDGSLPSDIFRWKISCASRPAEVMIRE